MKRVAILFAVLFALGIGRAGADDALLARSSAKVCLTVYYSTGRQIHHYGSGTVIHKQPGRFYVLTCHHVVDHEGQLAPGQLMVESCDCLWRFGKVVGHDPTRDLCLVRVDNEAWDKVPVAVVCLANGDETYAAGTEVVKCGFPRGGPRSILRGRTLNYFTAKASAPGVISVLASAHSISGDSGGGLFRAADNRLAGVVWGCGEDGLRAVRIQDVLAFLRTTELAALVEGDR